MNQTPVRQYLKDYQPSNFQILTCHLTFEIHENKTLVTNEMRVKRASPGPLILVGPESGIKGLSLRQSEQTDQPLQSGTDYILTNDQLSLTTPLDEFALKVVTELEPSKNTALEGLYQSGTGLCTQCEPESFRRITYFLDRPDVMATYQTTIIADKKKYPILLSNGNRVRSLDLKDGRHQVDWEDPFPKPCYLFALVAGDYGVIKDTFNTRSGRTVALEIYCEHGNESQCHHAMEALKRSMKWDEEAYGREYDLDQYLILAVDDFNAGAMENKGLNIFNSRLVFADSLTATDQDFERVESVIAHEYFHNWTGNRITLRDWFQLSLKEGLTVFREQQYMGDMSSEPLKRIDDVQFLRDKQFPEDAGPNAHPVRPESCLSVDNFFTTTVYEKGSEVIRVLQQLLGEDLFKKGMDFYFSTFDGQAITIEDFLFCFQKVSGKDLSAFKRWYSQAGTPKVKVDEIYDPIQKSYTLLFTQSCDPTPGQSQKDPFVIPIKLSLFSPKNKKPLELNSAQTEIVLELSAEKLSWTLPNCSEKPIPSLLRGMTAPVHLDWSATNDQLEFLALNETDGFNQWECLQKLALQELTSIYNDLRQGKAPKINNNYVTLYQKILEKGLNSPDLTGRLIDLPSPDYLIQVLPLELDPNTLSDSFDFLQGELAQHLRTDLWSLDEKITRLDDPQDHSFKAMGLRSLQHHLWKLLGQLPTETKALGSKFQSAKTMNEQAGLLNALNQIPSEARSEALDRFIHQWSSNSLVVNKWLTWHASFNHPEALQTIKELSQSPHFKASNPNKVRALYGAFALNSWRAFHNLDGSGYGYFAERILEVDALNPQTAARLCQAFESWYRLEPVRRNKVRGILSELLSGQKLSKNSFEILKRSLDFQK